MAFWEKHWHAMVEDISYQLQRTFNLQHYAVLVEQIREDTLASLEMLFNANSTTVAKFNLLAPTLNVDTSSIEKLLLEELNYNIAELKARHQNLLGQLNFEQNPIYEVVLKSIIDGQVDSSLHMAMEGQAKYIYGEQ
ncbi:hypothetical protein PTKIN_Ptkin10aG0051600 [Pterospermum kingtungense]